MPINTSANGNWAIFVQVGDCLKNMLWGHFIADILLKIITHKCYKNVLANLQ